MTNPIKRIHNAETGEIIDRPMTDEEFAEFNELIANVALREQEAEAKQLARSAILEKLGITEEEAKTLLS